ncbi:DUF4238 domain-containing protein [Embleya sp. NPDC005575]|uniref:DUF4238 domain-containing protein n=1 Tax=Embleya sp. NPDC005575 TaxID=3156892 RepID=UPI0033AB9D29
MSYPKRHHYVPRKYLERFGRGEQVRVRRRRPAKTHIVNVKNIAAETGLYTVTTDNGTPSTAVEQHLAALEGNGIRVLRQIDQTGQPPAPGSEDRETLALYLAVQMARTPGKRVMVLFARDVTTYAGDREVDQALITEYEHRRLGRAPKAAEARAAWTYYHGVRAETGGDPTHDDAVIVTLGSVKEYLPFIHARHWRLELSRKPCFLTSDAPLVLWRPPSPQDAYQGFGLMDAEEIRFPLGPHAQLVLTRGEGSSVDEVKLGRVAACNQDLADTCERVVVGHPDRHAWLDRVELCERGPELRFNLAPGFRERSDGSREEMGEVLHFWTTRR